MAEVTAKNFDLTIYSGKDRIWSTDDCSKAIKPTKKTIKAEEALEWSLTWNGRRSRSNCKNRPEIPKSGTYFATAQVGRSQAGPAADDRGRLNLLVFTRV